MSLDNYSRIGSLLVVLRCWDSVRGTLRSMFGQALPPLKRWQGAQQSGTRVSLTRRKRRTEDGRRPNQAVHGLQLTASPPRETCEQRG